MNVGFSWNRCNLGCDHRGIEGGRHECFGAGLTAKRAGSAGLAGRFPDVEVAASSQNLVERSEVVGSLCVRRLPPTFGRICYSGRTQADQLRIRRISQTSGMKTGIHSFDMQNPPRKGQARSNGGADISWKPGRDVLTHRRNSVGIQRGFVRSYGSDRRLSSKRLYVCHQGRGHNSRS